MVIERLETQRPVMRLMLPSKGSMVPPIEQFLEAQGLHYSRPNKRQYRGNIIEYPEIEVLFQRATDAPYLVHQGFATLGITGYDVFAEYAAQARLRSESLESLIVVQADLGFAPCSVQMSVPETWHNVNTIEDVKILATKYPSIHNRPLCIATHYPGITERFLQERQIHPYILTSALNGSYEAAPYIGLADCIVDFVISGSTVFANNLKFLEDGVILSSQACLLANQELFSEYKNMLEPFIAQLCERVLSTAA